MTATVVARVFESGDEEACFDLHSRAFGERWSWEQWRWRYLDNPLRKTELIGAFQGARCIASYAGVSLPFWLRGEETTAINQSDVCTDPDLRDGLGGSRLLVELTKQFFAYCGQNTSLIWGFPEPGLRRIVTRFARVEILSDVVFLIRDAAFAFEMPDGVEVRMVDRFCADADRHWLRCRSSYDACVTRDQTYLNWRYAEHPGVDYELLEVRDGATGRLRGLAVLRDGGWDPNVLSLVEWLVPEDDRQAEQALIGAAVSRTRELERSHTVAWFPPPQRFFHRFQVDHRFFANATPWQQGVRWWVPGIDRNWLHEAWYQTMGDFDFF